MEKVVGSDGLVGARGLVGVLFLCCVAVAACGSPPTPPAAPNSHTVAAENYARNCTSVAECFPVYEGPVGCCGGGCANAAIRADVLPKYMSDVTTAAHCDVAVKCRAPAPCETGRVACAEGACAFEAPDASATD